MSDVTVLIQAVNAVDIDRVEALLDADDQLANRRDDRGATAIHDAALAGNRAIARVLIERGAEINCRDDRFDATPAGWAIEYLRELGALLAIEIDDVVFAIRRGDTHWVARFLKRFPALGACYDASGTRLRDLAIQSGNPDIAKLFESD